jgi:signal transduction histidine kinase
MAHVLPVRLRTRSTSLAVSDRASTRPPGHFVVPLSVALGLAMTLLAAVAEAVLPDIRILGLDLVVGVLDCCVAGFAGMMAHGRFSRDRRLQDAALSIGLCVVAVSGFVEILVRLLHVTAPLLPLGIRGAGTIAIVVAGVAPTVLRVRRSARAVVLLAAPAIVLAVGAPLLLLARTVPLDPDHDGSPLERLIPGLDYVRPMDALIGTALVVAAVGFLLRGGRAHDPFVRVLGCAFALAAAARFDYVLFPELHAGVFSAGDVLRTSAYAVILVAAFRESREYWTARVELSMVEDRRRIARELHDGVVQELAFMRLEAISLDGPAAERLAAAADRALDESRGAVQALTSVHTDRLDEALHGAVAEMAGRYGFTYDMAAEPLPTLSAQERHAVLRIAREAVGNATRNGDAAAVRIALRAELGARVLEVADDGRGFDPAAVRGGFGLRSMRERAAALGGVCTVESAPGRGTTVRVVW